VDLNGSPGAGGIKQTFSTSIGGIYEVTFNFAGNPQGNAGGADPVKDLQVNIDSGGIVSNFFSFDTTGKTKADLGWIAKSFTFAAGSTSSTIELFSLELGSSAWGPTIDNVAVNLVPEPSSLGLLLLGGSLLLRRRRRTAA